MTLKAEIRQTVRTRARLSCEYCGVSEQDAGGELTVDHYQPQMAEGGNDLENLVYACFRCNLHKGDYWTKSFAVIFFIIFCAIALKAKQTR